MKKKVFLMGLLMLIAVSASVFYCKTMDNAKMTELMKANINALAINQDPLDVGCVSCPNQKCEMVVVLPSNAGVLQIPNYENYMEIIP